MLMSLTPCQLTINTWDFLKYEGESFGVVTNSVTKEAHCPSQTIQKQMQGLHSTAIMLIFIPALFIKRIM
jgi:hypothetical protein